MIREYLEAEKDLEELQTDRMYNIDWAVSLYRKADYDLAYAVSELGTWDIEERIQGVFANEYCLAWFQVLLGASSVGQGNLEEAASHYQAALRTLRKWHDNRVRSYARVWSRRFTGITWRQLMKTQRMWKEYYRAEKSYEEWFRFLEKYCAQDAAFCLTERVRGLRELRALTEEKRGVGRWIDCQRAVVETAERMAEQEIEEQADREAYCGEVYKEMGLYLEQHEAYPVAVEFFEKLVKLRESQWEQAQEMQKRKERRVSRSSALGDSEAVERQVRKQLPALAEATVKARKNCIYPTMELANLYRKIGKEEMAARYYAQAQKLLLETL